jgi:DNA-binding NtrC family response regulator
MANENLSFSVASSSLRGLRVLLVEDSWTVANAMRCLLEDVGMVIAGVAASAADAERVVSERTPELAVVDVNLQGSMAFGLIDALHDRGVHVVVVSGYASFSTPIRAAAILQKPFGGGELLEALCGVTARHPRSACGPSGIRGA